MRVKFSEQAYEDLYAIRGFVQADFNSHGARWYTGLRETILSLEALPHRGKLFKAPGTRSILYGNRPNIYQIIYQVDVAAETVTIAYIRHCRRRPIR